MKQREKVLCLFDCNIQVNMEPKNAEIGGKNSK